jgi:hypothetical protein
MNKREIAAILHFNLDEQRGLSAPLSGQFYALAHLAVLSAPRHGLDALLTGHGCNCFHYGLSLMLSM